MWLAYAGYAPASMVWFVMWRRHQTRKKLQHGQAILDDFRMMVLKFPGGCPVTWQLVGI